MHSLTSLRMLPPGGAPLPLAAIARALICSGKAGFSDLNTALGKRLGQKHLFYTSSGRGALTLLFAALHRANPNRNQILLPAFLSFSVPSAVVRAGCRIALYDVSPESLTPNLASLKTAISEQTLAVVAAHQYGLPFDLAPITALCREYGAFLVDDAAQVMGAKIIKQAAGTLGDAGIFSLSRGKPICAVEGGILFSNNDTLAEHIQTLQTDCTPVPSLKPGRANLCKLVTKAVALSLCRRPEIYKLPASMPWLKIGESIFDPDFDISDFTTFQASLALQSLEKLEFTNGKRVQNAILYTQELAKNPLARPIATQEHSTPIYLRFPVIPALEYFRTTDTNTPGSGHSPSLHKALSHTPARNLGLSHGFPLALCDIPELAPHLETSPTCPGARFLATNLITLPTHDQVRPDDALRAIACLNNALETLHSSRPSKQREESA